MNKEDFFDRITHIVDDARSPKQSREWSDIFFEEIREYYRLKCLEAIRNTRYAAIEILHDNFNHVDWNDDLNLKHCEQDIMNIDNNKVLLNL